MTKKDQIIALIQRGVEDRNVIAKKVGVKPVYISQIRWYLRHPGYKAAWMRDYRKRNPEAYKAELAQQMERYYANRYNG
jgi:hypothetical protein